MVDGNEKKLPKGGASFIVAWQLKDKRVLVVGGGEVASGRIEAVLTADAFVTLIAPRDGLHPTTKFLIDKSNRITYLDRVFTGEDDLIGIDVVLTAIDDVEWSQRICTMCRERRIPINAADIPPSCDFYFGAQIREGPLQVMISTNGKGPKLANIIKKHIQRSLPPNVDQAIENVGSLRAKLRQIAPGVGGEVSKDRMQWVSRICSTWSLDDLAELDGRAIDEMLDFWKAGQTPRPPASRRQSVTGILARQFALSTAVGFFVGLSMAVVLSWNYGLEWNFFSDLFLLLEHVLSRLFTTLNFMYYNN